MELTPMRYKDYAWPHNPETYSIAWRRKMAVHKVPFGQTYLQDLGMAYRVMRGEGVFAGTGAYGQFRELAAVFDQNGPGLLVHPVWQTASAYFVALELAEEPLPDYVRYSFEFWEDSGGTAGRLTAVAAESGEAGTSPDTASTAEQTVYTVKRGDTLWAIARRYNVALTALIRANPQIKNPNLIYPGDRVKMP